jgi:uncharacterized protein (DUF1697 family)
MKKTFKARVVRDGSMCFIPLPFDPKPVFGKVKAPVTVRLNGYTYRSTIASMGDGPCVPLRRSHREAAGLEGGETLAVTLELDAEKREVTPPFDLTKALKATPQAWERFRALSYTHQREYVEAVEGAKKPETRARRIASTVASVGAARAKPAAAKKAPSAATKAGGEAATTTKGMTRYAAFLRGVSPMNAKMPELKRCFEDAGFADVKTLLSSGNVVFSARPASSAALEKKAEAAMQARLGRTFMTIVRPVEALRALLASEPYATFRLPSGAKRVVTFFRELPQPKPKLPVEIDGARLVALGNGCAFGAYVPSPRGPVFMTLIEKTLGAAVTTRTWDTVEKCSR